MAPTPNDEGSLLWTIIKLVMVLSLAGGFLYAMQVVVKGINAAVDSTKQSLANKGVNVSKSGVAVKTDKRAMTQEETADKIQAGIMKGWKSSQFKVPTVLQGSHLAGSSHDKDKEEWEAKHGKKSKKSE